jgi:hypothetical protein
MNAQCNKCGSNKIAEVTTGCRIADVVGVTLDDGLVCDLVTFIPNKDDLATYYRCKNCLAVLPFTTEELVKFLRSP